MNMWVNRHFVYNRTHKKYSHVLSSKNTTHAIIIGILLIAFPSFTKADMTFSLGIGIEWLDEWAITETSYGTGTYEAITQVEPNNDNIPAIKGKAEAEGEGSSATARVSVSRQFRVVHNDNPDIPVRLQGNWAGRELIESTPGGDLGEVEFQAETGVEGTSIQYAYTQHHENDEVDHSLNGTIAVDGTLASNQTYTVTGRAYAMGDSDRGDPDENNGADYSANVTLSLPDPIVINNPVADYYYDVVWQNDWLWSPDSGMSTSGAKIDYYFHPLDGESYVYARGRNQHTAWVEIESERDFSFVFNDPTLAMIRFDGILTGDLYSQGSSSAVSLAQFSVVSVDDTILSWYKDQSVSNDDKKSIHENISAWGLAEFNQIYTFEAVLSLSAEAWMDNLAYADFLSSFEGELTVQAVPIPGSAILGVIGMASAAGILRRRRIKML